MAPQPIIGTYTDERPPEPPPQPKRNRQLQGRRGCGPLVADEGLSGVVAPVRAKQPRSSSPTPATRLPGQHQPRQQRFSRSQSRGPSSRSKDPTSRNDKVPVHCSRSDASPQRREMSKERFPWQEPSAGHVASRLDSRPPSPPRQPPSPCPHPLGLSGMETGHVPNVPPTQTSAADSYTASLVSRGPVSHSPIEVTVDDENRRGAPGIGGTGSGHLSTSLPPESLDGVPQPPFWLTPRASSLANAPPADASMPQVQTSSTLSGPLQSPGRSNLACLRPPMALPVPSLSLGSQLQVGESTARSLSPLGRRVPFVAQAPLVGSEHVYVNSCADRGAGLADGVGSSWQGQPAMGCTDAAAVARPWSWSSHPLHRTAVQRTRTPSPRRDLGATAVMHQHDPSSITHGAATFPMDRPATALTRVNAAAYLPATRVEYYSESRGGWIPGVVKDFDESAGALVLDVHPRALPSKVRLAPDTLLISVRSTASQSPTSVPDRYPSLDNGQARFPPAHRSSWNGSWNLHPAAASGLNSIASSHPRSRSASLMSRSASPISGGCREMLVPTAVLPRRRNVYADGPADNFASMAQTVRNPMTGTFRSRHDAVATRAACRSLSPLACDRIRSISATAIGSPETLVRWALVGQPTKAPQFVSSWQIVRGSLDDAAGLGAMRVAE